jgi:ATP synthase protein I
MEPDDLERRIAEARDSHARRNADGPETGRGAGDGRLMGEGLRVGLQFAGMIVGGAVAGWGLDRWLGTSPFGLLALLLAGFVGGLFGLKKFMTGP